MVQQPSVLKGCEYKSCAPKHPVSSQVFEYNGTRRA